MAGMRSVALGLFALVSIVVAATFVAAWYREHRKEHLLVLASGPKDSEERAFADAFAAVINKRNPRLTIRVIETFGSRENAGLLEDGTAQLALLGSDTPLQPNMRVAGFLFPVVFHLMTRSEAGVRHVSDVRGMTVGLMPEGSASQSLFWPLIAHYGLSRFDVHTLTIMPHEAARALGAGTIDAYFRVTALGNDHIGTLLSSLPLDLVAIDQGAALQLSFPALEPHQIPKGTYSGARPMPPQDLPVVGVRTLLVTTDRLSDDIAYHLTRVLNEARKELVAINPRAAMIRPVTDPLDQGVPLHPGTEAYFRRDEPLFIVQYAEALGFALSVSGILLSALWHVKLRNERRVKNRADIYNGQVIALCERAQRAGDLQEVEAVQTELFAVFRQVFADLDADRISADAVHGFTLAMSVAAQVVHERRAQLGFASPAAPRSIV
jgi:TRAP transporter TAXI family solute receptor